MLLAVHFYEDFIDEECVAIASMLSLQTAGINGTELDTPEPYSLSSNGDTSLGKEIFDITVAEIETIVEPDGTGNDIGWESVALISIHGAILAISPT